MASAPISEFARHPGADGFPDELLPTIELVREPVDVAASDIVLNRVEGVHGPRSLDVVITG